MTVLNRRLATLYCALRIIFIFMPGDAAERNESGIQSLDDDWKQQGRIVRYIIGKPGRRTSAEERRSRRGWGCLMISPCILCVVHWGERQETEREPRNDLAARPY